MRRMPQVADANSLGYFGKGTGESMKRALLIGMVTLCLTTLTRADLYYFHFDDPVGDHCGSIDVVGLDFTFDRGTGDYTILLTADAANPFRGKFRININVFNPDTGVLVDNPSYFEDTFNDYDSLPSVTTLTLTGTNVKLRSWDIGDRVATSWLPFGYPTDRGPFSSMVWDLPLSGVDTGEDLIARGDDAVIAPVPLPGATLLGMLGLGVARMRLRRHA